MPEKPDLVWQWSEQFLEVVEIWLREPPADAITRWNWSNHQLRLVLWRSEVLAARRRYVAYPESLRCCTTVGEPR
jgi:hypothetical protein